MICWARCIAVSLLGGSDWVGWIPRPTLCGVRSASGPLTAVSSSRWAGTITRAVEDQYQLGVRGLAAQVADLRAAVEVLEARCARVPESLHRSRTPRPDADRGAAVVGIATPRNGSSRPAAWRRCVTRLTTAQVALAAGQPSITVGGKRLWHTRNHLEATDMTEPQWQDRWDGARMFLTADGESGKPGGNETIRVDADGPVAIKTPAALVGRFGPHAVIGEPIGFSHRGGEWNARASARQAVRYDISYDPDRDRWYLDASWKTAAATGT